MRNRLLASPRFQRWATSFPLTRPVARRRSRELFDLCAGFVYAQVLFACVQVRLFDILHEGPQTVSELSKRVSLSQKETSTLLLAAASLRLVGRLPNGDFMLGPLGAAMLGNPAIGAMVEHHRMLYADLQDPVGLLRGQRSDTELGRYWSYAGDDRPAGLDAERVGAYTALMSASQPLVADEVLDVYPFRKHRCLIDVGGGDGTFLTAAAARAPNLRMILFDLPPVAGLATERFASTGLASRATAVGGDFLSDPLPSGADIASLVRIIHDHDDSSVLKILRAVRTALPADGTLIVAEPMSGTAGAEPIGDAYFGFYLLAMGSGRPRTADQIADLLRSAGFDRVRELATRRPLLTRVMLARAVA